MVHRRYYIAALIARLYYYFSSTEKNDREALTSHLDLQPPYLVEIPKSSKFLVRAVHRF